MDDGERIPIDLGYEEASAAIAAEGPSAARTSIRDDGTIVIDILAEQPCTAATEGEIVVCAQAGDGAQYRPPPPPPPEASLGEKLNDALSAKLGPVEIGSIDKSDGTRFFGARIRFRF